MAREPKIAVRIPEKMGSVGGFHCTNCNEACMFSAYVAAHWDIELIHTCQCGTKHAVLRRTATRLNHR